MNMKELLYIGKFYPWTDKNEDALFEALQIFDSVKICVMTNGKNTRLKKGQPTQVVDKDIKHRVSICKFKKLKNLLGFYKDNKYIMFERNK